MNKVERVPRSIGFMSALQVSPGRYGKRFDLLSINANGSGGLLVLASVPTPVAPDEVFKGVTSNGRVIFERVVGGFTNLYSIKADGSEAEIPLATTAADKTFGGTF